ncbi:MAG: hypothetical protein JNK48_21940 [Bryobacterales bacterium]|nr:hypothetical protein [Bryobacterales bacterium]
MKVLVALLVACLPAGATDAVKIWDKAPYNSFTDLSYYGGRWICVFREGASHFPKDGEGIIRVVASSDGSRWDSIAELQFAGRDLRDPKLSVTPQGELMLTVGAVIPDVNAKPRVRTLSWFSRDGVRWGAPVQNGEDGFWLWRVTWHKGVAYSVAYAGRSNVMRLYASRDGRGFSIALDDMGLTDFPNEATLLFRDDDTAYCFVRRDDGSKTALLGWSKPPYRQWQWKDLGRRVGSPHFINSPGGRMIGAVRYFEGEVRRVSIVELSETSGMKELQALPSSNGDSGYAGLFWKDGELWVSYYSTHDRKRTSIYLARWKP